MSDDTESIAVEKFELHADCSQEACTIDVPYLVALNAPCKVDRRGEVWADISLAKDLMELTRYIPNLSYLGPALHAQPTELDQSLPASKFRFSLYEAFGRPLGVISATFALTRKLLSEVPKAGIVHTCIAGHPFPVGWIAIPIARFHRKKIVVTVESSFWRIPSGDKASLPRRVKAWSWERINRWCMSQVDYASYPHDEYRRSLPAPRAGGGELFQASWIDEGIIADATTVRERWNARLVSGLPLKLLFATRMVRDKGVHQVLEAAKFLATAGSDVLIDFIGEGPEKQAVIAACDENEWARTHMRVLESVPYGNEFFELLTQYDAILSPILSDEQPRVVYDGYSQGVPSIASDGDGLRVCVLDGQTGLLVRKADAPALARSIQAMARDPSQLRELGLGALDQARKFTHRHMHDERCVSLRAMLTASSAETATKQWAATHAG